MKIAIIGGGIGGLTTALALRQAGFEPEVFEQAPELLEVGAAIAMWPNALRVLLKLGVGERIIERAGLIENIHWLSSGGNSINRCRLPIKDAPAVALHRADLQNELLHAIPPASVHLGYAFIAYQQDPGGIEVKFANGTSITCDVLIGADGIHSDVRDQTFGTSKPYYRGYTVWRGVTKIAPPALEPAAAMELQGQGKRFGIGPVGRDRIGWWASANEQRELETDSPSEQEKLLTLFSGWWVPVTQLIESTPARSILRNSALDRPATKKWGSRRMTLLGDAIHPTTPNLGQGGCMAVEDAVVLARSLANSTVPQALRTYEKVRHSRTAAVTGCSRLYGRVGQWESSLGILSRRSVLSVVPEKLMRRLLSLVFDYDAYKVKVS